MDSVCDAKVQRSHDSCCKRDANNPRCSRVYIRREQDLVTSGDGNDNHNEEAPDLVAGTVPSSGARVQL